MEAVIRVIDDQLSQPGQSLEQMMGSELDAAKTISSLTLFASAGLQSATAVLDRIGRRCSLTMKLLRSLLKNPAISARMGQLSSPDARSTGAQRLPVLLRVD
ncbi:hypothetical protein H8F24_17535 [Synechococcus sp. CBW1002]|uniref:hypothetical protein n=1 Tax=Synechococcus sp. CBW1002 TaxID=1353134 RepID=UPI0018CE2A4D|nr:hypothetical protein [Synechococcus sp. CBW1002]QPN59729.1 hypothetical protein H8F24_17535 [Synechococcus sp. CBW1002]